MTISDSDLALLSVVRAASHTPLCYVLINGSVIANIISVDVVFGTEQQSTSATIRISADAYIDYRTHEGVEIRMGYRDIGAGVRTVFVGEIEDLDTKYLPYAIDIKAAGFLKRLQRNAGNTDPLSEADPVPVKEWNSATDTQIWQDIMRLGGVPLYTPYGTGDSRTITGPIKLMPGDSLRSKIDALDQASESGQKTFEQAGTVYRAAALRIPLALPNWSYAEGRPVGAELALYSLGRQRSDRSVQNQVIITAAKAAGTTTTTQVGAVRQQPSSFWGVDGDKKTIYVPFSLQSDFLETREQCDAVAERYMFEHNKITDVLQMRTPLNPLARPASTVGIRSGRLGLDSVTPYWVRQISHHYGSDGASTDWSLEGGAGSTGYLVGLPPVPLVKMKITQETYQAGIYDTPTTMYTITADGTGSFDPDGTALSFAWSNNKTGDTSTASVYHLQLTEAQFTDTTTPPTLTLVVTDSDLPDAHDTSTGAIPIAATGDEAPAKLIAMYVAAYGVAEATPDGWKTANTWTPPANCLCCCRIAAEGTNYFGLESGAIYKTTDYLATTPIAVTHWTPGGVAITAIWMSELNTNKVAFGLANGDFYITEDAFATAPVLKRNFGNPVQWINGSAASARQWRAAVGQDLWFTVDDWSTYRVLVTMAGLTIKQTDLTPFRNYASALGAAGAVVLKTEDGVPIAFPSVSPAPAEAHMSAFILTDALLVGDDQGRSYLGEPASAAGTLVQKTSIGHGYVHDMLRDNTNPSSAYAACATALAKTFDKAASWVRVRTYNGTTNKALQLGYDSAPLVPPVVLANELIERLFQAEGNELAVRSIRDFPPTEDPIAHKRCMDLWNTSKSVDATGARNSDPPTDWYKRSYVAAVDQVYIAPSNAFGGAGFVHHWRAGDHVPTNNFGGQSQPMDRANYAWIQSETNSGSVAIPSGWVGQPGPGSHPRALFRHKFTLPAIAIGVARIAFAIDGFGIGGTSPSVTILECWINDVSYAVSGSGVVVLPTSLLTADGVTENLVSVYAVCESVPAPGLAYKVTVGVDSASDALFTDTATGLLMWGSTSSEAGVSGVIDTATIPADWYARTGGAIALGVGDGCTWPPANHVGIYALPWPHYYEYGKKLANMISTHDSGSVYLFKQQVDLPAGADTPWYLYVRKSRWDLLTLYHIYINDVRLSTPTPASPYSDTGNNRSGAPDAYMYRFDIPSGTMVMGGRNAIAFWAIPKLVGPSNRYTTPIAWYLTQVPP